MAAHGGGGGGRSSRPPVEAINLHPPPALPLSFTCSFLRPSYLPRLCLLPLFSAYLARLSSPASSSYSSAFCSLRCAVVVVVVVVAVVVMEGKKKPASSSSPTTTSSSSSLADLFGGKSVQSPTSSSFFHSVFPPPATVMGRDSSRSDIFSSSWKQEAQAQTWNAQNVAADGMPEGSGNRERHSAYQHEKIDPCSFSSSLYYGGQDICTNTPSSHNPGYNRKKDGEDDSNNPNAASRGNWWQGSLYY